MLASIPWMSQNADAKEPLGRIHEIFGPTHTPHYTVRVEGAADHHMLETRYQMAVKKLMKAEQVSFKARGIASLVVFATPCRCWCSSCLIECLRPVTYG